DGLESMTASIHRVVGRATNEQKLRCARAFFVCLILLALIGISSEKRGEAPYIFQKVFRDEYDTNPYASYSETWDSFLIFLDSATSRKTLGTRSFNGIL